jgi:O-antigen/teichoic acid export membrane protein
MLQQVWHVLWGRVGMATCRVLALMVLAHLLTPSDLGRLSFLIIIFVVFTSFMSLGVVVAGPVIIAEAGEKGRRMIWPMLIQAVLCTIGSMILLTIVRLYFKQQLFEGISDVALDMLLASLLPGQLILAQSGYLTGREHFFHVSLLGVVQWGGYLLAVVLMAASGQANLTMSIVCFLAPAWLAAAVGFVIVLSDGKATYSHQDLKTLVLLGWRSQLTQVLHLLQMRLDMILLRVLTSADQLGYYSVATNLSEWMLYLPRALQQIAMPRIARNSDVPARVYGWLFGLMAMASLSVGVMAPWLIEFFFGFEYLAATSVVRVLLAGTVLLGLGTLATGALFGHRDTTFLSLSGLIVALAFLVADLWAVPRWGALGAASVSCVLYSFYAWVLLWRLFVDQPGQLRACFKPSLPWKWPSV